MLSSIFSLSSSLQNNTEKQITSQKSSSSIDCRHFNFDLVCKKIPSASLFYRLIRYNDLMETKVSQESLQSHLSFFTTGSSFQATETILATGTTIWKPAFKQPSKDYTGRTQHCLISRFASAQMPSTGQDRRIYGNFELRNFNGINSNKQHFNIFSPMS